MIKHFSFLLPKFPPPQRLPTRKKTALNIQQTLIIKVDDFFMHPFVLFQCEKNYVLEAKFYWEKAKKKTERKLFFNCADIAIASENDWTKKQWNGNGGKNHLNP